MKPIVDQEKCIGCGACVAIAPDNFDFNEEGLSSVIGEEVTDETRNAVDACPVYAISIEEVESSKKEVKETENEEEKHTCECGDDCDCGDDCKCEHHKCKCEHADEEEIELEEAA